MAGSKRYDAETEAMLFQGASISQLAHMFKQEQRKVKSKIFGLIPAGQRSGTPVYHIAEAARYLVEPIWPIDEYIKRMNHADLPMLLRKEYWAGMRSKQIYEIAAGDLWPTEQVQEHIADILKTISMSLRLSADTVDRETGLTENQREIVIRLMDDALANAHRDLKSKYQDKPKATPAKVEEVDDDDL